MELLAYFVNENTLMEAVENSLKNGLEDYGASSKVDKESTDKRKEVEVVTRVSEDQVVETIEKFEADMN
ncbi:uncharacterized protein OCT59_006963 [Rhizophagus irregularis]|uniref:uncharacterized protein n=1 Tax=Rhizophagus irregularis TaxID=588596 RepID=UPI003319F4D6|nr:hypothetical protein OCT59_006963 [Rhizophagus irregularis]